MSLVARPVERKIGVLVLHMRSMIGQSNNSLEATLKAGTLSFSRKSTDSTSNGELNASIPRLCAYSKIFECHPGVDFVDICQPVFALSMGHRHKPFIICI